MLKETFVRLFWKFFAHKGSQGTRYPSHMSQLMSRALNLTLSSYLISSCLVQVFFYSFGFVRSENFSCFWLARSQSYQLQPLQFLLLFLLITLIPTFPSFRVLLRTKFVWRQVTRLKMLHIIMTFYLSPNKDP